jgi:hypothetical protein
VAGGGSSITKVDLDALLTEYGVTSESHRERLQALNRRAKAPAAVRRRPTEQDDLVTVRVLPFEAGAHPGLDPFTLLQFDAGLPDALFLDANRSAFTMITGDDPQVAKYVQDFEDLIEDAWSAGSSIEFMRKVADEMS